MIHVTGTPATPRFKLAAIPGPFEALKSFGQRRVERVEEKRR